MMKPYYEHRGQTIYHCDCREVLPGLPPVDHVITDPPYSDRTHRGQRQNDGYDGCAKTRMKNIGYASLTPDDVRALVRILHFMVRGWMVMLSDSILFPTYRAALEQAEPDTGEE